MIADVLIGGGSFITAAITGLLSNVFKGNLQKHTDLINALGGIAHQPTEEDKKRTHELEIQRLALKSEGDKRSFKDVQNARKMTNRFVGITRRGLAWSLIIIPLVWAISSLVSVWTHAPSMTVPISHDHSVLFGIYKWTTTNLVEVKGVFMISWFQQLLFMVYGFYFGREATK